MCRWYGKFSVGRIARPILWSVYWWSRSRDGVRARTLVCIRVCAEDYTWTLYRFDPIGM